MFFNHRKICAALQPPPGLGRRILQRKAAFVQVKPSSASASPARTGFCRLLLCTAHRMLPIFIVLMGFLLRKERIPSRAPFDIVLSISPDIFAFLASSDFFCAKNICFVLAPFANNSNRAIIVSVLACAGSTDTRHQIDTEVLSWTFLKILKIS